MLKANAADAEDAEVAQVVLQNEELNEDDDYLRDEQEANFSFN